MVSEESSSNSENCSLEASSASNYEDVGNILDPKETMTSTKSKKKTKKVKLERPIIKSKVSAHRYSHRVEPGDLQFALTGLLLAIATFVHFIDNPCALDRQPNSIPDHTSYNLKQIDALHTKFPDLLSPKEIRVIKTRLAAHTQEVSILMLLGRSRDYNCNLDPTFCIGQAIANVTKQQYGYIDASDTSMHIQKIERLLAESLGGTRPIVMIDSLERLHGSKVMNLFQFIDRDPSQHRKGMLILTVYTGTHLLEPGLTKLKGPEIVEKVLTDSWSNLVPSDSLNSVISRLVPSLVKLV